MPTCAVFFSILSLSAWNVPTVISATCMNRSPEILARAVTTFVADTTTFLPILDSIHSATYWVIPRPSCNHSQISDAVRAASPASLQPQLRAQANGQLSSPSDNNDGRRLFRSEISRPPSLFQLAAFSDELRDIADAPG